MTDVEMVEKKTRIWQLAKFLHSYDAKMSGPELVDHLNRNKLLTGDETLYALDGRWIYTLINATWHWFNDELGLTDEAVAIAEVYVTLDGAPAWKAKEEARVAALV